MAKYKAVLFDFDDTLVDTSEGKREAYGRVATLLHSEANGSLTRDELVKKISKISEEMNRRRAYDRDEWWRTLAREHGLNITRHLELRATVAYWASFKKHTKLYPDTLRVLDTIKAQNIPVGVVTDTDGWVGIKRWRLNTSPIFGYFDAVVIAGEDTYRTKPDIKPFRLCAERLGVRPQDTLFVGDKPYTDIVGAKSTGMVTALVKRRAWDDVMGANFVFDSLTPILEIVL
ncbi:MAG: HAD family hydrolase [Thermoprotei archaeon]